MLKLEGIIRVPVYHLQGIWYYKDHTGLKQVLGKIAAEALHVAQHIGMTKLVLGDL